MKQEAKSKTKRMPAPPIRRTAGEALGEGMVLELIQGEPGGVQPRLLIWDGTQPQCAERFTHGAVNYVPIRLEPTVGRAMRLPGGIVDYGSTGKLFHEVSTLLARVTRLPDSTVTPLTFFIFATWLADSLPVAPFLWIVAPPTAPREPLLELLWLLCRRAFFINELSTAALRSLPEELQPTVMTEASAMSRSFLKALRASNRRGSYDAAGGKVRDLFCAKIVCAHEPLADSTITGLPLEIALVPTRERVPLMEAAERERVAAEFQPKLLMYRLMNRDKVVAPSLDLNELSAPVRDLAGNLAMSIVGDAELQRQIVPLLQQRDREIQVDRTFLLECVVLEALLATCHDSPSGSVSMADLTTAVNTILAGRGEALQVSPETVGWKLRALGLHTEFITGGRKGLALLEATRVKIHSLAAAYGVRSLQQGPAKQRCPQCPNLIEGTGRRESGFLSIEDLR